MTHLVEQYGCKDATLTRRKVLLLAMQGAFDNDFDVDQRPCLLPADVYLQGVGMVYTEITAFKKGVVRLDDHWWWFALSNNGMVIEPGQHVKVVGLEGYTLLVESVPD